MLNAWVWGFCYHVSALLFDLAKDEAIGLIAVVSRVLLRLIDNFSYERCIEPDMIRFRIRRVLTDLSGVNMSLKVLGVTFSGLEFFETSAKENINVKAVFERLVDIICDKMSESLDSDPTIVNNPQTKRLTENPNPQNGGCQC